MELKINDLKKLQKIQRETTDDISFLLYAKYYYDMVFDENTWTSVALSDAIKTIGYSGVNALQQAGLAKADYEEDVKEGDTRFLRRLEPKLQSTINAVINGEIKDVPCEYNLDAKCFSLKETE